MRELATELPRAYPGDPKIEKGEWPIVRGPGYITLPRGEIISSRPEDWDGIAKDSVRRYADALVRACPDLQRAVMDLRIPPRYYVRTSYHVWTIIDRDTDRAVEHIGARGRGDAAARKLARERCDTLNGKDTKP